MSGGLRSIAWRSDCGVSPVRRPTLISAPEETRRGRTDVADVTERQGRLLSDEEKAARADFVYVNDGSLDDLDAFVRIVVQRLAP